MSDVITMDKAGRLVLPGPIRKALHISKPTAFRVEVVGNKVELTVLPMASGAVFKRRKGGLLVVSTKAGKFDAAEVVGAVREERL